MVSNAMLEKLYGKENIVKAKERYDICENNFITEYNLNPEHIFRSPGRTEISGNHTDHNLGKVLAASVNLDTIAFVSKSNNGIIRIKSREYSENRVDVGADDPIRPLEEEKNSSNAIIRGVAARFVELGYKIGGLNAYTHSTVLKASGLSSSASFEVLIGTILNHLYNDGKIAPKEIAKIAQYAENKYFGKPCGLMDQMTCSVGGFVSIDFKDKENPVVESVNFDFLKTSHSLCIVDVKAGHADLTDDYGDIKNEMGEVAKYYGKECLSEVDENRFYTNLAEIRKKVGDRPILRAIHFFNDNNRVKLEKETLQKGDFETFKKYVIESRTIFLHVSTKYLQYKSSIIAKCRSCTCTFRKIIKR